MFGVCPKCRTAYHWDVPRFGCSCGQMADTPPTDMPSRDSRDYTALGRSPFSQSGWWGADRDRDRDRSDRNDYADRGDQGNRPRPATPRPATTQNGFPLAGSDRERTAAEREREIERDQRRREREAQQWERRDGGSGRGRGRGGGGGRKRGRQ